ncbi:hypothetical protein EYV94_25980 [Puteibacter caeruleilacunae]|nr:hypothetical protein EYV94_25980 [Puteibacter caeruleilacunae]
MRHLLTALTVLLLGSIMSCKSVKDNSSVISPDKKVEVHFSTEKGVLEYQVEWQGVETIRKSELSIIPNSIKK